MTKPTTLSILIITIALMTVGITGSQLADAATATLTNSQLGQADASSVARQVTFTTAEIPFSHIITDVNILVDFEKDGDNNCSRPDTSASFSIEIGMSLRSPSGTLVKLVLDRSSGSPTYPFSANVDRVQVTFDDEAATSVVDSRKPVSGTFRPIQPLSAFDGQSPLGTWTFVFSDDGGADFLCFFRYDLTIVTVPTAIPVDVDVKPGSDPNSYPCKDVNKEIPVAVLSDAGFDATTIDADTVRYGVNGNEAAEVHEKKGAAKRHVEDKNKDGLLDMVFHFKLSDTGFSCDDIAPGENSITLNSMLTGISTDGQTIFEGSDLLRLVRK